MVGRVGLALRYLVLALLTALLAGFLAGSFWMVHLAPRLWEILDGIGMSRITDQMAPYSERGIVRRQGGMAVRRIDQLNAAEEAGIAVRDTIIAVNGVPLREKPEALYLAYLKAQPGTLITFQTKRGNVTETKTLVVKDAKELHRSRGMLGAQMIWLTPERATELGIVATRGVLIDGLASGLAAERAGLRPQDVVLKARGNEIPDLDGFLRLIVATRPGEAMDLEVARGPDTLNIIATLGEQPPPSMSINFSGSRISGPHSKVIWTIILPSLLWSLLCLIVGAFLGWARPRDSIAFQCGILFLGLGVTGLGDMPLLATWPDGLLTVLLTTVVASTGFTLFLTLRVFSVFPSASKLGRQLLRWQWPFLAFLTVWGTYETVNALSDVYGWALGNVIPMQISGFFGLLGRIGLLPLLYGVIVASLVVAQRIEDRRRRVLRRLRVLLGCGVLTVIALFLLGAGDWIFKLMPPSWHPVRGVVTYYLPSVLLSSFPIGFAYTILARKVFGIRFIIRRGIQHLLLSRGVFAVEGLLLFLIVEEALRRSQSRIADSVPAVAGLAAATSVFAITGLTKVNKPFMRRIDRRFFRENYDARTVLLGMSQKMSGLRVRVEILEQAGQAILATLHPGRLVFMLGGPDAGGVTAAWSGTSSRDGTYGGLGHEPQGTNIPGAGARDSERLQEPIAALRDGRPWFDVPPEGESIRAEESEGTGAIELLIAIPSSHGMIGCIALAGKLSEEPFSREDKELLTTVATQMGLALENAQLLEVAKREAEQAKELGIARQVQQNLFPKDLPKALGWDFAAICRPAREVGGDYYDIFQIDEDHIALALGDVSGKGIGPALVMSNVQAMIRAELRRPGANLGQVLSDVNEHLYSSTSAEMFITLFLAVLNTRTGEVRYANGGHNPPFVAKCGTEDPTRLTEAGPIVGIIPGMLYSESSLTLELGSTLVIYSDGVTEAINQTGDMYGEDCLEAELSRARECDAAAIMRQILDSVDRFAGDADQADDISLIIIRRGDQ